MQVANLANVFPTETMEAGTALLEQGDADSDGFELLVDEESGFLYDMHAHDSG